MGKIVGMFLVLGGVVGVLYSWISMQKEKQMRLEEFILFLQKSIFAMESEKVKVIDYFAKYVYQHSRSAEKCETLLEKSLHKISERLSTNTYPNGQTVWEEVFKEEEQNWNIDKETFGVVLRVGAGFFGRSREENICFLQKSLRELENLQVKINEKDAQERKVWVPVGMLGTIMMLIVFL